MKILYISSSDSAGQQFNGYVLQKELQKRGHQTYMAVAKAALADANVFELGSPLLKRLDSKLIPLEKRLDLYSVLPVSGLSIYGSAAFWGADIVHLQLIQAARFFSLLNVPVVSHLKSTVWTIHDPWLLSGHCVHPLDCNRWLSGCGSCPHLDWPFAIHRDTTALTWQLKKWIMKMSPVNLVVASQWMQDRVTRSPILSHLPCHVIPFGLDRSVFRPRDKEVCRERFGIPADSHVLLFRSIPFRHSYKGTQYVEEALRRFKPIKPTYLITLDDGGGLDSIRGKYHFIELGWVDDRQTLIDALSAADLLLMPSIAEAFGLTAVEAMACGTPAVVFADTALADVVKAPRAGIVVPYEDAAALGDAIQRAMEDDSMRTALAEEGQRVVDREYTIDRYVERHLELYRSLSGKV